MHILIQYRGFTAITNKYKGKKDEESQRRQQLEMQAVYEKYGSVKAPIIAHIVANVFSVLATHFKTFDWIMADQMRGGIITVACATIAASMYVFIQRMDDETE